MRYPYKHSGSTKEWHLMGFSVIQLLTHAQTLNELYEVRTALVP